MDSCISYHFTYYNYIARLKSKVYFAHPVKINLNKKLDLKQKTIWTFNIDAQGFRKTKNENPPTWEIKVTS